MKKRKSQQNSKQQTEAEEMRLRRTSD